MRLGVVHKVAARKYAIFRKKEILPTHTPKVLIMGMLNIPTTP
jgi:hypothetical protein